MFGACDGPKHWYTHVFCFLVRQATKHLYTLFTIQRSPAAEGRQEDKEDKEALKNELATLRAQHQQMLTVIACQATTIEQVTAGNGNAGMGRMRDGAGEALHACGLTGASGPLFFH